MVSNSGAKHPPLSEELKSVTRHRMIKAAQVLMARKGLGLTVDEVAEEANVSARTVFRHFATRDDLLVAAISDMRETVLTPILETEADAPEIRSWLRATTVRVQTAVVAILGRAWWEIYAPPDGIAPDLEAELQKLRDYRASIAAGVAERLWRAVGQPGDPPPSVADACMVNLSAFGYHALAVSRAVTPEETGEVCADIVWAVLQEALPARRGSRSRA